MTELEAMDKSVLLAKSRQLIGLGREQKKTKFSCGGALRERME